MSRKSSNKIIETELIKFLKARMSEMRINQAELARRTGLSACGISLIITNGNVPSHATLNKFALVMDVPAEKLFRLAGLLPKEEEKEVIQSEALHEIIYYFNKLTPSMQEIAIGLVRSLAFENTSAQGNKQQILVSQPELLEIESV